jgi:NAD(P)-dependent dehydrogenase (short-subunit alcohol dehydrogenase family)
VDGRGVRLPTIVVRAGTPNAATTSCFSGVIREPLAGVDAAMPIARNVPHAVTGARSAVTAMLTLHDAKLSQIQEVLGYDRTVFLPAVALSLGDLQDALLTVVVDESKSKLGNISYDNVDETLSSIVASFPTKIDADRALKLGIPPAPDAETLVRDYIKDFPTAVADGIQIIPPTTEDDDDDTNNTNKAEKKAAFDNKVVVITGGGSGIGRAIAERLSCGGWVVVLAGRRMAKLRETQELLQLQGRDSLCVQADVSVEKDVERLFQMAETKYGRVDLLFNNAGVNCPAMGFENVSFDDFERVLKTNVCGPFLCARAAMRLMSKTGGGRIINNGSISAHTPRPGSACYTASKHAVLGLTKCIALDGRSINVACGQIDFGNVVSELSLETNKAGVGAMQPNGTTLIEPSMSLTDAAETFWAMANLPLTANILQMTVMASGMPFVGRG